MSIEIKLIELVKLSQEGDTQSFGKIYELLVDRVYRFFYLRLGKKEESEDQTGQLFLKMWKNLNNFQEKKGIPFEAWIFQIARNQVTDYYRLKKTVSLEGVAEIEDQSSKQPEQVAEQTLSKEKILKAMEKLNDSYREIIVFKFIEDLSNKEVSQILGKPESHVRVLQNRALKALRKVLENE